MTINKITESAIEIFSIDELKQMGCTHISDSIRDNIFSKLMSGEVRVKL